jgi:4-carboxymuconolactone decarboxylase
MTDRPSAPRIQPAEPPYSPTVDGILEASKALGGDRPINIFTTMAHHGRALKHTFALGGTFLVAGNVPDRERELIILRVARNTRCEYEYAQHVSIGQRAGLSLDEVHQIVQEAGDWAPHEQALLDMVDELCDDDCVTDDTWGRLAGRYDERQLVELLLLTGYYRMLAGFLNSAGVALDPGLAGWPD